MYYIVDLGGVSNDISGDDGLSKASSSLSLNDIIPIHKGTKKIKLLSQKIHTFKIHLYSGIGLLSVDTSQVLIVDMLLLPTVDALLVPTVDEQWIGELGQLEIFSQYFIQYSVTLGAKSSWKK